MTATNADPIDLSLPLWRDDPAQLQAAMLEQLSNGLTLKADLPRPADTLMVQLILAAKKAATGGNHGFTVLDPSGAFLDGLQTLGLRDAILGQE